LKNLTVLSRTYCHLCDDMIAALQVLQSRASTVPSNEPLESFTIDVVDIDAYPDLELKYGDKVPVLLATEGKQQIEICHYFLDKPRLASYLLA
jgi:Glutaredoxin-like domain (DUF836)